MEIEEGGMERASEMNQSIDRKDLKCVIVVVVRSGLVCTY